MFGLSILPRSIYLPYDSAIYFDHCSLFYVLKSGNLDVPSLLFCIKIVLAINNKVHSRQSLCVCKLYVLCMRIYANDAHIYILSLTCPELVI